MKEQELIRKLNSVGKTIFVEYFDMFKAYSDGLKSKKNCTGILVTDKVSNENGAAIRCGNAKLIFKANMENYALEIITASNRLDQNIIDKANMLIN